jgi:hypothetical protein
MEALLEVAKYAWRHRKEKRQYVMDDMTMTMLDIDGENFATAEYGLVVSNSSKDAELAGALKSLAQAGLQNDKLSFGDIMTIYMSDSMASVRRKIQTAEEDRMQVAQQQAEAENQKFMADLEQRNASEQAERDLKWNIALLNSDNSDEAENPDENDIKKKELSLKEKQVTEDLDIKKKSLTETIRKNKANEDLKRAAINKPKTTGKS